MRKQFLKSIETTVDFCDSIVCLMTNDWRPGNRNDYGFALTAGLVLLGAILLVFVGLAAILLCALYFGIVRHTVPVCCVLAAVALFCAASYALGRARKYVNKKLGK